MNASQWTDWNFLNDVDDVNVVCDFFYDVLFSVLDTYVPIFVNKTQKYPKWFSQEIISNMY